MKSSDKQLANLRPVSWKPGQSGNPAGKPKGIPNAATRYQRQLNMVEHVKKPVSGEIEDFTVAEILDMQQMKKAREGESRAYKEVMDRLEGTPRQSVDMTSNGTPIVFSELLKEEEDGFKTTK